MTAGDLAKCWIVGGPILRLRAVALALRGPPLQCGYPGSLNARNSAEYPLPPIATTMYCFPFNM